jgi:hypothetical protein
MQNAVPLTRALRQWTSGLAVVCSLANCSHLSAQTPKRPARARPPSFSREQQEIFFPDALEQLGPGRKRQAKPVADSVGAGPNSAGWSRLISSETLEDEIKRQQLLLAADVKDPGKFRSGGYRNARFRLSWLAALMAVNSSYDASVRWQREAADLWLKLSGAASACKAPDPRAHQLASECARDMSDLVHGTFAARPSQPKALPAWSEICPRAELMKRLDEAQRRSFEPGTAQDKQFRKDADRLAHEAQVVALLSDLIARNGYEHSDDETYRELAGAMREGALSLRSAAEQKDYKGARKAVVEIGRSCTDCHQGFRD